MIYCNHILYTVHQCKRSTVFTQQQQEDFILKIVALLCEVILNLRMKCPTGPSHAKWDHSKPDHVEPNQGLHHQIIMCRERREQTMNKLTLPTLFVGHNLIFKEARHFGSQLCSVCRQTAPYLAHSLDQAVLSMGTRETVTC